MAESIECVVIGAGVIGLAIAREMAAAGLETVVLEKEHRIGTSTSSRNSEVIHAGIYYQPGSLKADFCRKGVAATLRFCRDNAVPHEQCGKLIVATNAAEHERMLALYERAMRNRIEVELLDEAQLRAAEPNVAGIGAILSPTTGIVDYSAVGHLASIGCAVHRNTCRNGSSLASLVAKKRG